MTWPHQPGDARPVVQGREQRWRWWIMRVNPERRCYVFIHDVERYAWACLWADTAVSMLGGDVVVWDAHESKVLYDSRRMPGKYDAAHHLAIAEHIERVRVRLAADEAEKTKAPGPVTA